MKLILLLALFIKYFSGIWGQVDLEDFGVSKSHSLYLNEAQLIYKDIFENRDYRKELAPINGLLGPNSTADSRFLITINLQLLYLFDLDVAQQVLTAYLELEMIWLDPRLAWDPKNHSEVEILWVHCDQLWVPDNFIVNAKSATEVYPDRYKSCILYSNGTVNFDMIYLVETSCPVNIERFPFDTQVCKIDFSSNTLNYYSIRTKGGLFTKYLDISNADGNGEWSLLETIYDHQVTKGLENKGYEMIAFHVYLKREPNFYIYVITIPCFLLTLLSIVGCFWTRNLREEQLVKLSIALTSMMSMTTFIEMVSQQMPKTAKFPLLGIFVLVCVFIISIACVILVIYPEKRKIKEKIKKEESNLMDRIRSFILSTHFIFFFLFQLANLINFIVFLSFWE